VETLLQLCRETQADTVYWNRLAEPFSIRQELAVAKTLRRLGIKVSTHDGTLLFDPKLVLNRRGIPFRRLPHFGAPA
jgi:deoxyribodipyrimidine photo-lyase